MNNNKTYFVTLTPLQLFFFGGEQGEKADYYLKGSFIPQQTALLGFVRHQILLQNELMEGNKIKNDSVAESFIGKSSFEWNQNHLFGRIESISPCYIVLKEGKEITKYLPYHQAFAKQVKKVSGNFFLPEYDPKNYYPDIWMCINKKNSICNTNELIYKEIERIGVDKNYSGKTQDESFFKQVWLKMSKGFSFGFYVTLEETVKLNKGNVIFGKESAPFFMDISDENIETFADEANPTAILLTSDSFVEKDLIALCDFAITDTIPFRNIVNKTSKSHTYFIKHKSDVRLQLYKRGSVFFPKPGQLIQITKTISDKENFKNIGYNHFHLLNIPI